MFYKSERIIQDIDIYSRYFDIITISDGRLPEEFAAIKLAYPETVTGDDHMYNRKAHQRFALHSLRPSLPF